MISKIESLRDVEDFAKTLVSEDIVFHPDDDFTQFVNTETNEPSFPHEKGQELNSLMQKCFEVCTREGVDIYDFMLEIMLMETGMDSQIPLPSQNGVI